LSAPQISDHALVRFLERVGGMEIEAVRDALAASLHRAHQAARTLGRNDFLIRVDGAVYVVRGDVVVTVLDDKDPRDHAHSIRRR